MKLLSKELCKEVLSERRYTDSEIIKTIQNKDSIQPFICKIEKVFASIPESRKNEVLGRFKSSNKREHLSAIWELLIADILEKSGLIVEWNGEGEPDLAVIDEQENKYMIEIRGLYASDLQGRRNQLRNTIENEVNKLPLNGWLTLSCIHSLPLDMDINDFVDSVARWCESYPPERDTGEHYYQKNGVRIKVEFHRTGDYEKTRNVRYFLTPIEANRYDYIKNVALREKGKKYGKHYSEKGIPIIVALADSSEFSISDDTIQYALLGSPTVSFFPGTDKTETGLDGKGYITPKEAFGGARNKWLSAVMFFQSNWIDGDQIIWSSLYRNYWAKNQADSTDFGARKVFQGKENDDSTIRYDWVINDN